MFHVNTALIDVGIIPQENIVDSNIVEIFLEQL